MSQGEAHRFYKSKEWKRARRKAMLQAGLGGQRGYIVDHIKPLATHPHLALEPANLRVMPHGLHNTRHTADRDPKKGGSDVQGNPIGKAHPWNTSKNLKGRGG